jgi:hypothetical protein
MLLALYPKIPKGETRKKGIRALETEIERIKRDLLSLGDLRPGSLSQPYNVCGNPRCRCKEYPPRKQGPYYQLSFTRKGKSGTRFIRKSHVAMVKKQVKNYGRLRTLVDRWMELSTQLCQTRMERETG